MRTQIGCAVKSNLEIASGIAETMAEKQKRDGIMRCLKMAWSLIHEELQYGNPQHVEKVKRGAVARRDIIWLLALQNCDVDASKIVESFLELTTDRSLKGKLSNVTAAHKVFARAIDSAGLKVTPWAAKVLTALGDEQDLHIVVDDLPAE